MLPTGFHFIFHLHSSKLKTSRFKLYGFLIFHFPTIVYSSVVINMQQRKQAEVLDAWGKEILCVIFSCFEICAPLRYLWPP